MRCARRLVAGPLRGEHLLRWTRARRAPAQGAASDGGTHAAALLRQAPHATAVVGRTVARVDTPLLLLRQERCPRASWPCPKHRTLPRRSARRAMPSRSRLAGCTAEASADGAAAFRRAYAGVGCALHAHSIGCSMHQPPKRAGAARRSAGRTRRRSTQAQICAADGRAPRCCCSRAPSLDPSCAARETPSGRAVLRGDGRTHPAGRRRRSANAAGRNLLRNR